MRTANNLTTFMCRLPWNLGASTSWNPLGLFRPVMGLLYLCFTAVMGQLQYSLPHFLSNKHCKRVRIAEWRRFSALHMENTIMHRSHMCLVKRRLSVSVYYEKKYVGGKAMRIHNCCVKLHRNVSTNFSASPAPWAELWVGHTTNYERGGEKHTTLPAVDPRPSSSRSIVLLTELPRLQDSKCFSPQFGNTLYSCKYYPWGMKLGYLFTMVGGP